MRRPHDPDRFDGVRITAHPRRSRGAGGVALFALIAVVVAALAWWWLARRAPSVRNDAVDADRVSMTSTDGAAPGAGASGSRPVAGARSGAPAPGPGGNGEDPTPDLADYVLPGEAPTMRQVIDALHARGIRTGLGAFNPPGTSPPLRGLEVPDGFPLPEGYVRHHQATDDGQSIAPILMFSPDIDSIVVGGRRVPVPADRIVTPELAPAGMPLRWVVIPAPRDGGRP